MIIYTDKRYIQHNKLQLELNKSYELGLYILNNDRLEKEKNIVVYVFNKNNMDIYYGIVDNENQRTMKYHELQLYLKDIEIREKLGKPKPTIHHDDLNIISTKPRMINGISFGKLKKIMSMLSCVGNLELKIVKDKNKPEVNNIIITNELKYECEDCDSGNEIYLSEMYNKSNGCVKCNNRGYVSIDEDDDIRIIYKNVK